MKENSAALIFWYVKKDKNINKMKIAGPNEKSWLIKNGSKTKFAEIIIKQKANTPKTWILCIKKLQTSCITVRIKD